MMFRNRTWIGLLLTAILLLVGSEALAQQLAKSHLKNGYSTRFAFRDVVANAGRSTVRVLADGEEAALGTIVSADGFVVTKSSQLAGEALVCQLQDGRDLDAELVAVDRDWDLALLKIEASRLRPVQWSERQPEVGQWLATPGSGELPVAVGVMSVLPREIRTERGVLGVQVDSETDGGAAISQVFPNTGADRAGLRPGDVVLRVADTVIDSGTALTETIRKFRPGDSLNLLVRRGDAELDVRATLGDRLTDLFSRGGFQNRLGGELSLRRSGFPSVLQHDTVLKPEHCGGPVVDLTGRAVGVNIARAGRTESYAIPRAKLLEIVERLRSTHESRPGLVAASAEDVQ